MNRSIVDFFALGMSANGLPVIACGNGHRVIASIQGKPNSKGMIFCTTVPDLMDHGVAKVLKIRQSTPVVRVHRVKADVVAFNSVPVLI